MTGGFVRIEQENEKNKYMNLLRTIKMRRKNNVSVAGKLLRSVVVSVLLLWSLSGLAMAQGTDNPVVIKKNISVTGANSETHYLAHIENSPGVCVLQDVTDFDPATCLWYTGTKYNHTGKNHNYYFEDGTGTLRYLSAPMAADGTLSLSADKPAAYQLSNTGLDYYFYNWDGVGLARGRLQFRDRLFLVAGNFILRKKSVFDVDAQSFFLQIPDVSEAGLDRITFSEELFNCPGLGRGLHND